MGSRSSSVFSTGPREWIFKGHVEPTVKRRVLQMAGQWVNYIQEPSEWATRGDSGSDKSSRRTLRNTKSIVITCNNLSSRDGEPRTESDRPYASRASDFSIALYTEATEPYDDAFIIAPIASMLLGANRTLSVLHA
jgi:hypothetical protein